MNDNLVQNSRQSDKEPFFSVIITTYNRAKLISRALYSLIAQTEKDWEAIIVDDGSTDDTYLKISPYLKAYPNVQYLKQPNQGESAAKNRGMKAAKGKFITFLDSDDEFHPSHLESRKAILLKNPAVLFLYGGAKILGNPYVPDRFDHRKKISLDNCIIGGTFFIEKSTAILLKGYKDILLGPDADFFDRAQKANIRIMKTNLPTYLYHHETEDSITNKLYSIYHSTWPIQSTRT